MSPAYPTATEVYGPSYGDEESPKVAWDGTQYFVIWNEWKVPVAELGPRAALTIEAPAARAPAELPSEALPREVPSPPLGNVTPETTAPPAAPGHAPAPPAPASAPPAG